MTGRFNPTTGPAHPFAWGVIRYVTVETTFPVLVSISEIVLIPVDWIAVIPLTVPAGKHDALQV